MRRASVETIEKLVQSKADQARERRISLTIMNCIWARNTEQETSHPVHGEVIGKYEKLLYHNTVFYYFVISFDIQNVIRNGQYIIFKSENTYIKVSYIILVEQKYF